MSVQHTQAETGSPAGIDSPGPGTAGIAPEPAWRARSVAGVRVTRFVYPAVLVLATIGLSSAGLSGSSVGVLATTTLHGAPDPALVAGTPRPIRSDEWNVETPLVVAQSHHGFPRTTLDGVGSHDLSVLLDVPNSDWSTAFRPWNLPPLALDLEHGFAARWWLMSLFLLLGAYVLLLALTDRTDIAVLFSLGLWLSPFFHWWYSSGTLDSVGMGMLALGASLYAMRAKTAPRRAAWLALAAYSTVSFALVFYPPFQIPIAFVLAVVGISEIVGRHRPTRMPWRRPAVDLGIVAISAVAILLAYYLHAKSTIAAINGTAYPGHRRLTGGVTSLLQLLSAPFGLQLARHGAAIPANISNQSEISSFVLLAPFVLLQLHRMRLRDFSYRSKALLLGTSGVFLLLAAWYLVSLPPILARVLLLDRVEPQRSIIGIGTAGILLAALFCAAELQQVNDARVDGRPARIARNRSVTRGALACALAAFFLYFWGGRLLRADVPSLGLSLWKIGLASAGAALVVFLITARKAVMGGLALVAFGASISLPANPLYRGLGPLTSSPLLSTISRVAAKAPISTHRVWLSFQSASNDELTASGVPTLTAANAYPIAKAWTILDPEHQHAFVWNRYANVFFAPGPAGSPPTFHLIQSDAIIVTIDPCGRAADRLGVGFVLSDSPVTSRCLTRSEPPGSSPSPPYIYIRSTAGS